MCITDYFKLLSCSCAIKTLNLKFLTENKVRKVCMAIKMIDELYAAIMELDTKKSRGGKSGLGNGC